MATEPKEATPQTPIAVQATGQAASGAVDKLTEAGLSVADQFTKRIAEMQFRVMPDMEAMSTAHRRNMEALSAAYRASLEGAQAVARRNGEIMQQAVAEMEQAVRAVASDEAPKDKAAKQAELLKEAYQHAVANMKDLSDLIQKSSAEAIGLLNKRFSEGMDEVKAMMEKSGAPPGAEGR
jgi:phasin family protein